MKTFSKIFQHLRRQTDSILRISILSVAFLILAAGSAAAQGTLTGFVVDDEFSTPIEKAVVTIPGTMISVLTDQEGKYSMKLVAGDYLLEVNYPGYWGKKYNMSVSEGITTPMFIVKLKANAVGRAMQRRITLYENRRQFPQTVENLSIWQIAEQTGHQEFNELFRTIPSASYLSNGSGFNDSGIGFRGNNAARTSYTMNGILLNNPETGRTGSSLLSGLTDWAGQIQVVSGQAANLQSQTNSGGLINVLSLVPQEKGGAEISAVYGNEGFMKTTATVHSGLSKKGLASIIQISRTAGNGLAQNTAFEQYGFFVNIRKELNHFHTLELNANGVVQEHNRNFADSVGAYNQYGTRYNRNWGMLDGKPVSWSTNYGRSPVVSLTHFWQPRVKTHVTTQLYAIFHRSAQLVPGGQFNNQSIDFIPRNQEGLVSFAAITNWNKGLAVTEMGSNRTPDTNGKFITTENSGIATLTSINSENRFGLRSILSHKFSKEMDMSGSFNLEHYQASHFGAVHDLLLADGYFSTSDINRPEGYLVENLFLPKFFPMFNSVDKTGYSYESGIQTGGFALRLNYQLARLYWFVEGAASLQNIRRTDYFNYLTTDHERQPESTLLPGGRAQTGLRINLWKYHSIHLRAGFGTYQPLFSTLFPTTNNWKNREAANEQVFDAEAGYTIFSRRLKVEALAYRSAISNRSEIRKSLSASGYVLGIINNLQQIHQGVELKSSYKLTKNLQLYLNGSYGDWKYSSDATTSLLNDLQTSEPKELLIKNIPLANAPQFSLYAEAEYRWAHNFYVRLNYYRADKIYAPFGLSDFENLADRSDFTQWQLPAYQLLGASGNYLLKIGKSRHMNMIFGANNLLDTEYMEQTSTNIPEGNTGYTSNQVYYGAGRTWFVGLKVQF